MSRGARAAAILGGATVLAYAGALDGPFQFDDFDAVVDVPAAHGWAAWRADLGHGLRPLLKLAYLADWTLGSGAPLPFHLTNLLIHVLNALLVWRFARHALHGWLPDAAPAPRERAALAAALLFALHPAQTEAVAYISGRSVSLMALLMLAALLAYLRRRQGLALLSFVAALGVKEPAAALPLLLLLVEREGFVAAEGRWRRLWAFWLLPLLLGVWLVVHTRYREFLLASLGTRPIADNLLSQLAALRYLVELALLLRRPNIDPDLAAATQWTPALALIAALLLAALALAWRVRRTRPWWRFGLLWFLIALLPTNSLLPRYDLVNDRQLYLALVGPLLALAAELGRRPAFANARAALALGLVAALLTGQTLRRSRDYRSELALWQATAAASPGKARPHNNLGYAYQLAGCDAQAAAAYRRAIALDPEYQRARDNLLVVEARGGGGTGRSCAIAGTVTGSGLNPR